MTICYCCNQEISDKNIHIVKKFTQAEEIWRCHANPFIKVLPK